MSVYCWFLNIYFVVRIVRAACTTQVFIIQLGYHFVGLCHIPIIYVNEGKYNKTNKATASSTYSELASKEMNKRE